VTDRLKEGLRRAESRGGKASVARQIENWIAGYHPIDGVPDEFMEPDGVARQHWVKFFIALARYSQKDLGQRFATADRLIRETGMSYRVYGETSERSWPLGRLPLLIDGAEWANLERGIAQRAELWDRALTDIYGEGRLVSDGVLPSSAILGSPDFIRPLHGVRPAGGRWLRFYAADIGRGPDGRWWVLGDRAQAPSGAGHALENRLVFSRVFANLYRDLNVDRLAGFFREFRAGLVKAADRSEPRICLLTPGPYSQTYYEQAYLARYLGFLLVEGGDLVVRDDKVHVRTIAGLKRADALLRRIDADWCDPLELNAASQLGVPGLMESIRAGEVVVANMPGAGLVESRALLGYLQAMSRKLMGEDLILPHIATWWCGDPNAAKHVLDDFDNKAISGAFIDNPPGLENGRAATSSEIDKGARELLRRAIERRGVDYVGQEIVRLSTTPAWIDGAITPRPFTLRVYAAATPDGWRVMPGGFCRMSDNIDARALSMGEGVTSADVWVIEDRPVEQTTLLPTGDNVRIVRQLGNLPSRAADNLFWFGRYLERAEATLRLVRCYCNRVTESAPDGGSSARVRLQSLLAPRRAEDEPRAPVARPPAEIAAAALHDTSYIGSGAALARAARHAASIIRERLSQDIWQILGELEHRLVVPLPTTPLPEAELIDRAEGALHALSALSGLIQENFNRVAGWSFLDIGRRVERGISTCGLARMFADRDATAENLDVMLDLIDSQITYRSRYLVGVALAPVRDMALLDPNNPRSVAFQVQRINEHLAGLPTLRHDGMLEAPQRIVRMLDAELSGAEAAKLDNTRILGFEQNLMSLAAAIEARYFLQGSNAVRAETPRGLA
jgi:uncharacterized circularly permuted ATP-grasp superfamily protein/uncharacterized alpha-E superfamily protein